MKKALNLIIMYFVFLAGALIFGTLLYTLFSNLLNYVAGSKLKLFSVEGLAKSFFYVSICSFILICPVIAFYRTRHPGGASQAIAYAVLSLITWGFLIPLDYKLYSAAEEDYFVPEEEHYLSKDYFRQAEGNVYYFTDDFAPEKDYGMKADAVIIHTGENAHVSYAPVYDTPTFILNSRAKPFREILVGQNFSVGSHRTAVKFQILAESGRKAFDSSLLHYVFFLSFGLALCCVYILTGFFEWRLLNSTLLFLLSTLVLSFNSGFFTPWLSGIRSGLEANFVYEFLERWTADPLIFAGDCLFAVVVVLVWIISSAVKNHKRKAR